MSKIMEKILTDASVRSTEEIKSVAAQAEAFEPWGSGEANN